MVSARFTDSREGRYEHHMQLQSLVYQAPSAVMQTEDVRSGCTYFVSRRISHFLPLHHAANDAGARRRDYYKNSVRPTAFPQ